MKIPILQRRMERCRSTTEKPGASADTVAVHARVRDHNQTRYRSASSSSACAASEATQQPRDVRLRDVASQLQLCAPRAPAWLPRSIVIAFARARSGPQDARARAAAAVAFALHACPSASTTNIDTHRSHVTDVRSLSSCPCSRIGNLK